MLSHWRYWRRKRRLRKQGVTVAFTDPKNPMRDWKPKRRKRDRGPEVERG